ncbi:inositol 1,4,5-trisphosphate receptor-interacting protein [Anolis carolinensis]|uniref:Inositol 1,4,5-trisphosphate receptor-interacting protein n=1 Tax=Anolis carolinensis TaxID=28377 RepID=G1KDR9_ANOCA|nr:PREDICTED: inositol 1,4,5-trisphosphate receptor-interacting protein [Anolis carolinensis]XP_003218566.1 PREDICTED: inositol 1,4,5-trisphosphate receptor-interacting protein [Anolis carolinensis]XP_008104812.1 PREDICTED: inositol 1,4,5-trisphosphate receptor-interacting protein [Anolis carolinensis]XP_008104813.1 PREDICTED: inositol 1,4,5-trisphosphate receptor-interacting protein [Anolis carolinensis]|eukprot:XP_003218565.1 PREDICTED: inositol 1,4,5-trisphosphate receptor-interacting protein [Anolis carolinensis]
MPGGIFRVCLVVITAFVNHPLLFPKDNVTILENTDEVIQKMKEREENLRMEQLKLEQEIAMQEALAKSSEQATESEKQYDHDFLPWNLWTALSMMVFLLIEFWRQDYQEANWPDYANEEDEINVLGKAVKGAILPEKVILANFHERCLQTVTSDIARNRELVEGFADDLLEALRSVCNRDADMEVEESIGIGSMYENWRAHKPLACDFIVPFTPPAPYCFQFETWCSGESVAPDKQGCGMIKISWADEDSTGCICDKTKLGEDLLCLLHSKMNPLKQNNHVEDLLCYKDTRYLDANQVMTWFQVALTKAWNKISHKYEFSLTFNHIDVPGALKIKFKSGKTIVFNLTPVVQYADSDVYFISQFQSSNVSEEPTSSIHWFLTFAVCEKRYIQFVSKTLPANSCHLSCLQILSFLHGKQCSLTGPSGLTNYHLKTVMLHLLQIHPRMDWAPGFLDARLKDMLKYLEKSLQEKRLYHFFIGNKNLPEELGIPVGLQRAEPLNLFRPFVLQRSAYRKTMDTFHEMLKNTAALINEYTMHVPNGRGIPLNKDLL